MAVNERLQDRLSAPLEKRKASGEYRSLRVSDPNDEMLNLANNDYLNLAQASFMREAGSAALDRFGCSASASPLISGYGPAHDSLIGVLKEWHQFEAGLLWNSGYVANQALLSGLPCKADLVLADRLIHNSMISGILASGARLKRYRHCDLDHLESLLQESATGAEVVFVVTESVFSMDGDYPDLFRLAEMRERYGFFWIVDEAHALGWYGENGSGLVEESGVGEQVDALVGTLGKALGSAGAYTLFGDSLIAGFLVNFASEFIYSTYLPPSSAAIAERAVEHVAAAGALRARGRASSRAIRERLRTIGYDVALTDSPIVSIPLGSATRAMDAAQRLEAAGIRVGVARPPTVPEGTSRLRISLKADLSPESIDRLIGAVEELEPGA